MSTSRYESQGNRILPGRTEFGAYATVCWSASKVLRFPLHRRGEQQHALAHQARGEEDSKACQT